MNLGRRNEERRTNTNINIFINIYLYYFFLLYEAELEELGQVEDEVIQQEGFVKPPEFYANGAVVQAIILRKIIT
jgi:hypothetical protein